MPGKLEFFSSLELLGDPSSFLDYLAPLREAEWVVYAKRPFAGPGPVSVLVRKAIRLQSPIIERSDSGPLRL
jgi:hypothetical protein